MEKDNTKWLHRLIVVLIVMIWLFGYTVGRIEEHFNNKKFGYERGDYSLPQEVILEKTSPDSQCVAYILLDGESEAYYFAIQRKDGPRMVVDDDVAPSGAYHHPVFGLNWVDNGNQVEISVDSHFGDFIRKFHFDINTLAFLEPVFWGAEEE